MAGASLRGPPGLLSCARLLRFALVCTRPTGRAHCPGEAALPGGLLCLLWLGWRLGRLSWASPLQASPGPSGRAGASPRMRCGLPGWLSHAALGLPFWRGLLDLGRRWQHPSVRGRFMCPRAAFAEEPNTPRRFSNANASTNTNTGTSTGLVAMDAGAAACNAG